MDERQLYIARDAVASLDLNSADGRAGSRMLLRLIEEQAPGGLEQMAANLQCRLGLPTAH